MKNKVILITIDGMRPDGLLTCVHPFTKQLMANSTYTLNAQTVYPSLTLPCHISLFHSVTPERHGITTNTYMPMARPLNGLLEQIKLMGGKSASFYGWEELRDIAKPGSLSYSSFVHIFDVQKPDGFLTDLAINYIKRNEPDFVFLHLLETDELGGHAFGWMSAEYLSRIYDAISNVKQIYETLKDRYTIILTADHGGHARTHGTTMPEDMTIPLFMIGTNFEKGKVLQQASILDIAPTIANILGVPCAPEWEGQCLI